MITLTLVIPLYRPPRTFLEALLDSLDRQRREDCEVILVADGTLDEDVAWVRARTFDSWISLIEPAPDTANRGISATSNAGAAMARGTFVGFVDQDDVLEPGCLDAYCETIAADPRADLLYCDEQTIDVDGKVESTFRKPDWNPPRLECQNYICHLLVIRKAFFEQLGGFRTEVDFAQDWDLCLRAYEQNGRFIHIRRILYSWRTHASSTAGGIVNKSGVRDTQRRVLEEHVARSGQPGIVVDASPSDYFWISRRSVSPVSIIIPTRASPIRTPDAVPKWFPSMAELCVQTVHQTLAGQAYEIIVVLDEDAPKHAAKRLRDLGCRIVMFREKFNFARKCNVGAQAADHDLLVFLNDDIVCQTPAWTAEMAAVAERRDVGAVGARLLFPSGAVQHAGHTFVGSGVTHACYGLPELTFNGRDLVDSETVGVTAACMMTRRSAFESVGGFSEDFPAAFNDVDLCQKLRVIGLRCISLGRVTHLHFESQTRHPDTKPEEVRLLYARWGSLLLDDPYRGSGDGFDFDFDRRERVPIDHAASVLAHIRSLIDAKAPESSLRARQRENLANGAGLAPSRP